ncbi:chemotaxis protein CheW [Coprothermobacter platensis]|uniref:chemotaxis protein CheW n=1 Tax=Coprothermobacter platensis TaxID=108819 RepID=UPI00037BAF32|nr:chemotaxis protein CheW [Coprothermobacter platensis]
MNEFVVFTLGDRKYALALSQVVEILTPGSVYPIPDSEPYVLGLTNIRGSILPVVDIRSFLSEPERQTNTKRHIWVRWGNEDIVIVVDRVEGIKRVSEDDLKQPPEDITNHKGLEEVFMSENDLVVVIDPLALVG